MTDIEQRSWRPAAGSLPKQAESGTVYVLPTRLPPEVVDPGDVPMYSDKVRYLPKIGRAAGIAVEFSVPKGERRFLAEYSVDSFLDIALALVGPMNDYVILAIEAFFRHRAKVTGDTEQSARDLPLRLSVAELNTNSGLVKGIQMEGRGEDVIAALKVLKGK